MKGSSNCTDILVCGGVLPPPIPGINEGLHSRLIVSPGDTRQSTRTRLQQLSDALSPPQVLYRTYLDLTLKGVPLMPSKPSNQRTRPRYHQMNFDRVGYSLLESFRHQALVLLQMGEIGKTQWTTINGIISNR